MGIIKPLITVPVNTERGERYIVIPTKVDGKDVREDTARNHHLKRLKQGEYYKLYKKKEVAEQAKDRRLEKQGKLYKKAKKNGK